MVPVVGGSLLSVLNLELTFSVVDVSDASAFGIVPVALFNSDLLLLAVVLANAVASTISHSVYFLNIIIFKFNPD